MRPDLSSWSDRTPDFTMALADKLKILKDLARRIERIITRETKKKVGERSWGRFSHQITLPLAYILYFRWPCKSSRDHPKNSYWRISKIRLSWKGRMQKFCVKWEKFTTEWFIWKCQYRSLASTPVFQQGLILFILIIKSRNYIFRNSANDWEICTVTKQDLTVTTVSILSQEILNYDKLSSFY